MKSGEFWVHCRELVSADFGRDLRTSKSWRARRNSFLLGKQRTILPISRPPNVTKFEHKTSIGVAMNSVGTEFWQFSRMRSFFQKAQNRIFPSLATSGRHNSLMITDRRKFVNKWPLYGISPFLSLESIQSHSPGRYTPYKKHTPNFLLCRTRLHGMPHNADALSGRGLMTLLGEGKDRHSITGNWVTDPHKHCG